MNTRRTFCIPRFLASLAYLLLFVPALLAWQPAAGPLRTRWAIHVSPDTALPEYPRPQMVRPDWSNLNGLWDYAVRSKESEVPASYDGQILVPFPIESQLSGVMKSVTDKDRIWYRRYFELPRDWLGRRFLLHFGAVDFDTVVYINGKEVGQHRGGYDAFSFDITDELATSGKNELVVSVWDPTDAGTQPRGKQVLKPNAIWYTPTSGIWQTVWIEPVQATYIKELKIRPNFDDSSVGVKALTTVRAGRFEIEVVASDSTGQRFTARAPYGEEVRVKLKNVKKWSPDSPSLYDMVIRLKLGGETLDQVTSYFGMRKISLGKDSRGFKRILLNNEPLFQFGPLDQGFWPDGLYTAPTDDALRYDIEVTKQLGFNLARKHVKIEPERWYYWCDKLGLLVWQDMPSGDRYIGGKDPDLNRSLESAAAFETELRALIEGRGNHPCIVIWVPFNEGWGQYDTTRIVDFIKKLDPSRLVINTSGWTDRGVGDINDMHKYPGPGAPEPESNRATVLGEFGGLGLPLSGYTWQSEKNWGYRSFKDRESLTAAYLGLLGQLFPLIDQKGLSAAVYTQTTDVEIEVNGLMTYDREVIKMDPERIAAANRGELRIPVLQPATQAK